MRALVFFSRKLSAAESHYSAFDRELLAVHCGIQHFRHMLEGRQYTVFTDHKTLVGVLAHVSEPKLDRQQQQLSDIAEFTADICHIAGDAKIVAIILSRPADDFPSPLKSALIHSQPVAADGGGPVSSPPAHVKDIAAAPDCERAHKLPALRLMEVKLDGKSVLVDMSSSVRCPVVPASFYRLIFDAIHNLDHPGIRDTPPDQ
jgi:hypothetical protein